jgi:hypothetical protein
MGTNPNCDPNGSDDNWTWFFCMMRENFFLLLKIFDIIDFLVLNCVLRKCSIRKSLLPFSTSFLFVQWIFMVFDSYFLFILQRLVFHIMGLFLFFHILGPKSANRDIVSKYYLHFKIFLSLSSCFFHDFYLQSSWRFTVIIYHNSFLSSLLKRIFGFTSRLSLVIVAPA